MIQNQFGQMVFSEEDVCELLMENPNANVNNITVDNASMLDKAMVYLDTALTLHSAESSEISIEEFDKKQQSNWHMPAYYKNLDIAEHVLGLCKTEPELQRCGQELLLYQDRNLFPLLQYLCYLVSVMKENNIIWGVGRGSSVASFVLYKLGVHRIDSLKYNLDVAEFLR